MLPIFYSLPSNLNLCSIPPQFERKCGRRMGTELDGKVDVLIDVQVLIAKVDEDIRKRRCGI